MTRHLRLVAAVAGVAAAASLPIACSNPASDGSDGPEATLDLASVSTGIAEMATVMPICRPAGSASPSRTPLVEPDGPSLVAKILRLRNDPVVRMTLGPQRLGPVKPADKMGDCGGRITYPTYNHANGTTSGTFSYENYCMVDSENGERITYNGSITFTNSGTPSPSGPITNKIEASSPGGVTEVTRSATGQVVDSRRVVFEDYVYTPGVPGGSPTSASPDRLTARNLTLSNQVSGKSYRHTDYQLDYFNTSSGGEQMTVKGTGYRSNGERYAVATTTPVTADADGDYTGGQVTFTGAGGTKAVLTVVPGSELQGTMSVNGQPVTNVPVCR